MPLSHIPFVIGHRGACAYAPENTLASFRKAADIGCRMVEFDVRLSADDIPVVFHDDSLSRTTNAHGPVRGRTLAELQALDAGSWFSPRFAGERIPTLAETLRLCAARDMLVNIEIKPEQGAEEETARLSMMAARAAWPVGRPIPLISSFSAVALAAAAQVLPSWPRALCTPGLPPEAYEQARALRCVSLHVDVRNLAETDIRRAHYAGFAVLAYTVNEPAQARWLWQAGAHAVFADRPDRIMPGS
jgi:glycerophosphoryl diester phosphodiesterase